VAGVVKEPDPHFARGLFWGICNLTKRGQLQKSGFFCQNFAEAPSRGRVWLGNFGFWGGGLNPTRPPPTPMYEPDQRQELENILGDPMFLVLRRMCECQI